MRTLIQSLGSFLILLLLGSPVYAQNAQISGVLKDQTGGVLPGVTVTAKNPATLGRGQQVEFIAQLFNIADRANFATPNGSITAANDTKGRPLFGESQSLLANINAPSRQAEFAVRWKF